ncbi:MAG TPA: serine/threonine-protein kinase [Drouetiella sp.]
MSQRFAHVIDVGDRLGDRYEVLEILGQGGMGTVYKAMHLQLNKPVAVKALHPQIVLDQNSMARFQQEIRAMSMLSHPHLISVLDAGTTPSGTPFFVMEFLDGPSLGDLLRNQGPPPDLRAIRMFIQMADALAYAHEQNIIHRDLKPSNVVVLSSNRNKDFIKLVDLGIAKLLEPRSGEQGLTMTGEIFGSPLYMSPEQCLGRPVDGRSDIYSLGCLMYETVCGETPIKGGSALETFNMHINTIPPTIGRTLSTRLTPALKLIEPIIDKCMRKAPEERFQSMAELSQALEEAEHKAKSGQFDSAASGADVSRSQSNFAVAGEQPRSVREVQIANDEIRQSLNPPQQRSGRYLPAEESDSNHEVAPPPRSNTGRYSPEPAVADDAVSKLKSAFFNRYAFAGIGTFAVVMIVFFVVLAVMHHEPPAAVAPTAMAPQTFFQQPRTYVSRTKLGTVTIGDGKVAIDYKHFDLSMPNPSAKEQVAVVAVYAGEGQENDDMQHFRGNVEVTVKNQGKPIDLVLTSYMATHWTVKRADASVQINRIMVSGYIGPPEVDAPAGVKVESAYYTNSLSDDVKNTHKYSENPFDMFFIVPTGDVNIKSKQFKDMQKVVETHLKNPISQLYACYREGSFTVE